MRYSNEHKAETRRRVLKEAAQEIRAKGPDGVAVAGVMARAGLTHGGFYAHFESKEAMIADAIGTMFDDALPTLSGDLARSGQQQRERFGKGVEALTVRLAKALGGIGIADPHAEGSAMLAQMVGAVALSRAVADQAQSDAILADAHALLVARYGLEERP